MRSGSDNQVLPRGYLIAEILLVLGLSLGRSGVYAVVDFLADLTSGVPLSQQTTTLNAFEQSLEPATLRGVPSARNLNTLGIQRTVTQVNQEDRTAPSSMTA